MENHIARILSDMAEERRAADLRLLEKRTAFIRARASLSDAEHAMVRTRLQAARGKASAEDADRADALFREAFGKALTEAGLPGNAFTYQPRCAACGDWGTLTDGRPCACAIRRLAHEIRTIGGLDPEKSFARFDLGRFDDTEKVLGNSTQREIMQRYRDFFTDYAAKFPRVPQPNVLFRGGTGLGKSFLMQCIGNAVADRGMTVIYTNSNMIQQAYLDSWESDRLDLFAQADLLLLDDLGAEPMVNKVTGEFLFNLLEERLLSSRPWIVTTNLSPDELKARYGERTASRLCDRETVIRGQFSGKDLRK